MARYRNDVNVPLNYGERGPWVEPGGEFSTEDYPEISRATIESHLASGFISEVGPQKFVLVDELHEHEDRQLIDQLRKTT